MKRDFHHSIEAFTQSYGFPIGKLPVSFSYSGMIWKGGGTMLWASQNIYPWSLWVHCVAPMVASGWACASSISASIQLQNETYTSYSSRDTSQFQVVLLELPLIGFREEWASLTCPKRKGYGGRVGLVWEFVEMDQFGKPFRRTACLSISGTVEAFFLLWLSMLFVSPSWTSLPTPAMHW